MDPFETFSAVAGLNRGPAPVYDYAPAAAAGDAPGFARAAPSGISAGSLGYGAGGPAWLDAFHTKRPPTPTDLVNAVKAVSYACIKLNAVGVAKVPLRLCAVRRPGQKAPRRSFRRASDRLQSRIRGGFERGVSPGLARSIDTHDEIDEVLDHPLLEALERPNEYFDRPTFLMYLSACLDATGAAYVFPSRPLGADGLADPSWAASELWPLQPQYVFPGKGSGGELVRKWHYFGDAFDHKEIVRVRWVSLRDPYLSGYAPLHACYEQSNLVDYYTATVEATLKGGARPDVVIGSKDPMHRFGPDERERFENDVNARFSGPRKGRAWVVDGAFDVHALSYPPADLGGIQLTREQRLLCANCFDVPISLLQTEDSNRATAQESSHQHQYYAIEPRCCLIAAALTRQLAQPVDDRLFFTFDDPVTRDNEREAKVWAMKVGAGQATINEWRADEGKPPVEWGDEPRFPDNLKTPAQQAEAADAAKLAAERPPAPAPGPGQAGAHEPEPPADDEPAPDAAAEAAAAARSLDARIMRALDALETDIATHARRQSDETFGSAGDRFSGGASPE